MEATATSECRETNIYNTSKCYLILAQQTGPWWIIHFTTIQQCCFFVFLSTHMVKIIISCLRYADLIGTILNHVLKMIFLSYLKLFPAFKARDFKTVPALTSHVVHGKAKPTAAKTVSVAGVYRRIMSNNCALNTKLHFYWCIINNLIH